MTVFFHGAKINRSRLADIMQYNMIPEVESAMN